MFDETWCACVWRQFQNKENLYEPAKKNIQTEDEYNLCYKGGLILELSVKIKMLGCKEWWDSMSVSE